MIATTVDQFAQGQDMLPTLVNAVRNSQRYAKHHVIDLNNGLCMPIAKAVRKKANELGIKTMLLHTEKFQAEFPDAETAKQFWGINARPVPELDDFFWNDKALSTYGKLPENVEPFVHLDYHAWVFHGGKHYDVEAPEGVPTMWDLPFFKRALRQYTK